jgi:hypothetical protein
MLRSNDSKVRCEMMLACASCLVHLIVREVECISWPNRDNHCTQYEGVRALLLRGERTVAASHNVAVDRVFSSTSDSSHENDPHIMQVDELGRSNSPN